MESLEQELLNAPRMFLGKLCEEMPLDFTLYEEDNLCTINMDSCKYCSEKEKDYLCNKKTSIFLPQIA